MVVVAGSFLARIASFKDAVIFSRIMIFSFLTLFLPRSRLPLKKKLTSYRNSGERLPDSGLGRGTAEGAFFIEQRLARAPRADVAL
jgi:hypothetical protein